MSTNRTLREVIPLPQGVIAEIKGDYFVIQGKRGGSQRLVNNPKVKVVVEDQQLIFTATPAKKAQKTILMTLVAHARNMVRGAQEGHLYKLKICSGHFPMNVALAGNELIIKNFLGEKYPRKMPVPTAVSVKVQGSEVVVESADKELAGQIAADIEQLTKITNRDRRVFQDGIYITMKDGKELL
ncbi:MAG TPA: 50S ribosomal protein L6 [Candidatus Nanoarchaeia archaeon]|nr:50S ribosomal protein L6 [Candidatus Nanoarchaeia archaeon]